MESETLWERCQGLALADFWHDPHSSNNWKTRRKFFCQVSNARFHRFTVDQISRNLNTTRWSVSRWKRSKQTFENFTVRGRFFSKKRTKFLKKLKCHATSGRHNSAMITQRRKFTKKWFVYGMSSFHFYH